MKDKDEDVEKVKKEFLYKGAKELLERNIIKYTIGKKEGFGLNFEYLICLRSYIKDCSPIKRKDLLNHVENMILELKKLKGFEIKLEPAGQEFLSCLLKQEISVINTPEDNFPRIVSLINGLSEINVFD
jgi:hypothetical protein